MSSDYQDGHAPTDTDENNAVLYATMNQRRALCLTDPVNYVWKEDPVVGYPCPEGLTCYSGKCEFTKQGCMNFSTLPYFDCKRKSVPCSFGNGQETCQVCDWELEPSGILGGIPCPAVGSPALTEEDAKALGENSIYCRPGDMKNVPPGTYDPTPPSDPCRPQQNFSCPGLPNTMEPYVINGNTVPCSCDQDCSNNGIGGNCYIKGDKGLEPLPTSANQCSDTPVPSAFCYPPTGVYTEWREGFTAFAGAPVEDACIQMFSNAKPWCEMPWYRPTGTSSDGKSASPACWKTQYKQPFYYRQEDGKCYITKSYCENNLGNGGFDGSFGDGKQYGMFSTCVQPQGDTNEVQKGYDCCTSLGASFAQFFFGQTLPAEFDNLRSYTAPYAGTAPKTYCDSAGDSGTAVELEPLVSFLSDERLKENIELIEENACGMGINKYRYTWSSTAKQLYKKPDGVMEGLLMRELEPVFPQNVRWSPYGHKMFAHSAELMPPLTDVKSIVYMCVIVTLIATSDVVKD